MGAAKLLTAAGGAITLDAASTATDKTITIPARTGNMAVDGPAFRAYLASGQTVSSAVDTKVQLSVEVFDTANCFNTTNYRFTPNVAGYYQFNVTLGSNASVSLAYSYIQIFKNGTADSISIYGPYSGVSSYANLSTLIYLNGSTDYVELYAQLAGAGTLTVAGGSTSASTYMSGCLVRSA